MSYLILVAGFESTAKPASPPVPYDAEITHSAGEPCGCTYAVAIGRHVPAERMAREPLNYSSLASAFAVPRRAELDGLKADRAARCSPGGLSRCNAIV